MKGGEAKTARPRIGGDVSQRSEANLKRLGKVMQKAALAAVGKDFLVDEQEMLRRQRFDLKAHLVMNPVSASEAACLFLAQSIIEQSPPLRQRLVGRGGDFGEADVRIVPRDDVARAA